VIGIAIRGAHGNVVKTRSGLYRHIPREQNAHADALANAVLNRAE